jgi:ferredoxin
VVACDTVLLSVGQAPALQFLEDGGADITQARPGWPKVDASTLSTTAEGVFAAGDLAHGTRLVIDAVASGKAAARSIYHYLTGQTLQSEALTSHRLLELYRRERGYESIRREEIPVRHAGERLEHPDTLVELGYDRASAMREASRCLDCGVTPVFDGNRCVLCGGCVDVCPTQCLKIVSLSALAPEAGLEAAIDSLLGQGVDRDENSAILKDEDRCIRCALCAMRCPVTAIAMERVEVQTTWRHQ